MGYDRDRLAALRAAMHRSVDELDRISPIDPAATSAARSVSTIRTTLRDRWLPVIDSILGCVALDGRSPVHLDSSDLRNAWLLEMQTLGWQVLADPIDLAEPFDPSDVTVGAVAALGSALAEGDLERLLDTPDELAWLTRVLRSVADDAVLLSTFRTAIGGDATWAAVLDHLGRARAAADQQTEWHPHDFARRDHLRSVDDAIGAVVEIYAAGPHGGHRAWVPTVVQLVEPYTAALLLQHLQMYRPLNATTLALICHQLLLRWFDAPIDANPWVDQYWGGDNTADVLFPLLSAQPAAAAAFLRRVAERPELVLVSAQHDRLVENLLLVGTSPENMNPDDAGRVLRSMIGYIRLPEANIRLARDGVTTSAHAILGSVIAPWLMQFGARADEWAWNADDGDEVLRWVLADADGAARLADATKQWQRRATTWQLIGDDGRIDDRALNDVATMFEQIDRAFRDAQIAAAAETLFWTNTAFWLAQTLASSLVEATPAAPIASSAISMVSTRVRSALEDQHVLASAAAVRADARATYHSRLMDTAVIAVIACVGTLIDNGMLPADALEPLDLTAGSAGSTRCTAEETGRRLRLFVASLEPDLDPLTYESLLLVTDVFAGPLVSRLLCE
ncbi:MAG: hypothetical protein RLZZ623_3347 [Actinomycetota bacterium]